MISINNLFIINVRIDLIQWLMFAICIITRVHKIEIPRYIVFDEIHYGRFASMYFNRTYFFDVHPPLGKLLIAIGGCFSDYNGDYSYDKIGIPYNADFPVFGMRLLPAIFGSFLVFFTYEIIVLLGLSRFYAMLASFCIICDNAILVQSRFMLIDIFLLFFISLMLISYLKCVRISFHECFSTNSYIWLFLTGFSAAGALLIKFNGIFTVFFVYSLLFRNLWINIGKYTLSNYELLKLAFIRLFALFICPIFAYISIFYLHLHILSYSGPHDNVMSSTFQSTLKGNLAEGQPLYITKFSQITLRSDSKTKPCWLHSHNSLYPVRYSDDRGSSHQQQVTCYKYKDVNNWWLIKDSSDQGRNESISPIHDGDIIELVHGTTKYLLNSHNVGAPLTPPCQEVSCYINHNVSAPLQSKWRVEIINKNKEGNAWKAVVSKIRLIHIDTNSALGVSGKVLPEWGFHQNEVVCDYDLTGDSTVWNVEEHKYMQNNGFRNISSAMKNSMTMSYFHKYLELQLKMIRFDGFSEQEHRYRTYPSEWPFLTRNLAYWSSVQDSAQIHLIGNPSLWWSASICIMFFTIMCVSILLYRKRYKSSNLRVLHFSEMYSKCGEICIMGYFVNYLPYFLMMDTLFLHNYLPALFFKILSMVCLMSFLDDILDNKFFYFIYKILMLIFIVSILNTYIIFLPISYGFPALNRSQLHDLMWMKTWIFVNS